MAIEGVLETCLYAADLEAAERFYGELLELPVFSREPGRHVFFRCGGAMLLVFNAERTASAAGEVHGVSIPRHGARGAGHVCFRLPESELEAWRDRLATARIPIEAEVRWPRGGASLYVRDPAGNSVELAPARIWAMAAVDLTSKSLSPVSLHGSIVSLEPLARSHLTQLARIALHPELWRLQRRAIESVADVQDYIDRALAEQDRGASLPFVIVRRADQSIIGSTRFMDIALPHRRLEIGATWLAPSAQRTGANVEAKLLLLAHAFDTLGMQKVVFKTETLNTQSRTAILALGAVEEGTFRRQLIAENGRARDMVYFSILDTEWPAVRTRLRARLERYATSPGGGDDAGRPQE